MFFSVSGMTMNFLGLAVTTPGDGFRERNIPQPSSLEVIYVAIQSLYECWGLNS